MSLVGLALIGSGLIFGGAGWGLTRADRLTCGQGAQAVMGGAMLALVGFLLGLGRGAGAGAFAAAGAGRAEPLVLILLLAAALGAWLRQAVLAARATKRLRRLATDHALAAVGVGRPGEE